MSDQKIASSGAAIFWEVAMDGNLANADGVEGADRKSATETPSPAPAILLIPYVIRSYNTTKPNKVGLSVIQITNLSKQLK